jgi:hypothetical protein
VTWSKFGDEFPAAARDLSDAAFRTHVEAVCWSNGRLLDLMIAKHEVRRFAETSDPVTAVEELVAAGWWQDCGDAGWYIGCRFAEWQLERSVIDHRRALAAERQRRKRLHASGVHSLCSDCSVTRDNPRDVQRDNPRDPGRDGSGRDGNDNYGLEEKEQGPQLGENNGHGHGDMSELWARGASLSADLAARGTS